MVYFAHVDETIFVRELIKMSFGCNMILQQGCSNYTELYSIVEKKKHGHVKNFAFYEDERERNTEH